MGQIPPKVCRQKPDRHDHKGSDKYRGKSADTAVQPDAADTAYQRGTGINMLYENIRFLSRHHVTHQSAAHAGEHAGTFLKISDRTLQRLRSKGEIAYSTIRGRNFYKIGEIKRLLESRLIKSNDECMRNLITNHKLYVKERRNIREDK